MPQTRVRIPDNAAILFCRLFSFCHVVYGASLPAFGGGSALFASKSTVACVLVLMVRWSGQLFESFAFSMTLSIRIAAWETSRLSPFRLPT